MLGDTTVRKKNKTVSHAGRVAGGRSRSWTETEERRALMLPQEIKALSANKEIIFLEGTPRPIMADKIRYYEDGYFKARVMAKMPLPQRTARVTRHATAVSATETGECLWANVP